MEPAEASSGGPASQTQPSPSQSAAEGPWEEGAPCPLCSLAWPDEEALAGHLRWHLRYAPFECLLCGLKFLAHSHAARHFKDGRAHGRQRAQVLHLADEAAEARVAALLRQARGPRAPPRTCSCGRCELSCEEPAESLHRGPALASASVELHTPPRSPVEQGAQAMEAHSGAEDEPEELVEEASQAEPAAAGDPADESVDVANETGRELMPDQPQHELMPDQPQHELIALDEEPEPSQPAEEPALRSEEMEQSVPVGTEEAPLRLVGEADLATLALADLDAACALLEDVAANEVVAQPEGPAPDLAQPSVIVPASAALPPSLVMPPPAVPQRLAPVPAPSVPAPVALSTAAPTILSTSVLSQGSAGRLGPLVTVSVAAHSPLDASLHMEDKTWMLDDDAALDHSGSFLDSSAMDVSLDRSGHRGPRSGGRRRPVAGTEGKRPERIECRLCSARMYPTRARAHVSNRHLEASPYSCNLCGWGAKRRSAVEEHQTREHDIVPAPHTMTATDLRQRLGQLLAQCFGPPSHSPAADRRCRECQIGVGPGGLRSHVSQAHLGAALHQCRHCDYTNSAFETVLIRQHVRRSHKIKPPVEGEDFVSQARESVGRVDDLVRQLFA